MLRISVVGRLAALAGICVCAGCAAGWRTDGPSKAGGAAGLLETSTLFTVYGRSFGVAPILGRLGTYKTFDEMAADVTQWVKPISEAHRKKSVVVGLHLIYGMATPCGVKGDCLLYLEGTAGDIAERYIKPAAQRGWVVILDTQIGRSTPAEQISRMIAKGYLKYENVHVAIDPEFHSLPGHNTPGIPIGTVTAEQVNEAQRLLDDYVRSERLRTKKILIVHQFGDPVVHDGVPYMIENKKALRNFEHVELVIAMDGLGSPEVKTKKYNLITDSTVYPAIKYRGIKVFYPNQWEKHGHFDTPPLTIAQLFAAGRDEPGDPQQQEAAAPDPPAPAASGRRPAADPPPQAKKKAARRKPAKLKFATHPDVVIIA